MLALALGAVAFAGLNGSGSTTSVSGASRPATSSAVIGPVIATTSPTTPPTAAPVGPVLPQPTTKAAATSTAKATTPAKPAAKPVVKPAATPTTKLAAMPAVPGRTQSGHVATSSIAYHVVEGDTLWSLTQRSLAATNRPATPGNVAAFVTKFYASNDTTVGSDPNFIVPGQTLTWPVGL